MPKRKAWFEFSKLCAKIFKGYNVGRNKVYYIFYRNDALEAVISIVFCFFIGSTGD